MTRPQAPPVPDVTLIHEGVEGLRVGRFDLGISSSCIIYRVGATVIDTGPPNQWRVVRRFLGERDVARVLITHHHEDHAGNGARCASEIGARVYLPEAGRRSVIEGFRLRPYQRLLWGVPARFDPEPVPVETEAGDGVRLRAIPAPGHSPDMTCYLEPDRGWLFTGDLYIASRPKFMRADETVGEQIASLRSILELDFETVFCAHRGIVLEGRRAIEAKLDYLVSLNDQIHDLHERGQSVAQITRTLLGRETWMSLLTFYHFSKRNLVKGCLESGPETDALSRGR